MASRTSNHELERVRIALIHSVELLSIEAIAVAWFTPISVATLLSRVGPILLRLRKLIFACETAMFGYASAETGLVESLENFRVSPSELAASAIIGTGLLGSTSVWVRSVSTSQLVLAPGSLQQISSRLLALSEMQQPIVRIEKYPSTGASSRFIVYIPGTENLGLPNSNPLDMRSNLQLMAGGTSASSRATEMAIRRAGAKPGDQVMLVGYSQGGMVAVQLGKQSKAAQLDYEVSQVVTFGSPVGSNPAGALPNVLSVENKADFVPHLDAMSNQNSPNWLTLEGKVAIDPLRNHQMESYQQIVRDLGNSGEITLQSNIEQINQFARGEGTQVLIRLGQTTP
jgi:pimeloyl-ACP methyl ester carboxylesterase